MEKAYHVPEIQNNDPRHGLIKLLNFKEKFLQAYIVFKRGCDKKENWVSIRYFNTNTYVRRKQSKIFEIHN